jgi:small subunit ribosomal protein S14
MQFLNKRQRIFRNNFTNIEAEYRSLKCILKKQKIPLTVRWEASLRLSKLMKKKSAVFVNNRCFLTGRGKSVQRFFNLSRLQIRKYALDNKLPYIQKASW